MNLRPPTSGGRSSRAAAARRRPGCGGLGSTHDYWIPGSGWSATYEGAAFTLATGTTAIVDSPVRYKLETRGRSIRIWVEGSLAVDEDTANFVYPAGTSAPAFGGVAFSSGWEQMFWIDDLIVTELE
ncbi:MAG: hypothetical protein H0T42_12260 [Deltaproteobacteria bacterium]|nr:hypothetical protein [Deltaproteobacteria bacterium]